MLTNSELVLSAAGIGVLGTVLGTVLSWLTGGFTARRQWQREEERRQAARRITLYEEMLAEVETRTRDQQFLRERGATSEPPPIEPDRELAERIARFNAWVMLFADLEVAGLWHDWSDVFSENWFAMNGIGYGIWQARTRDAARALATAMRVELDAR